MNFIRLKEKIIYAPRFVREISIGVYHCLSDIRGIRRIRKGLTEYSKLNRRKSFDYQKKYRWFIDESSASAGTTDAYYWVRHEVA